MGEHYQWPEAECISVKCPNCGMTIKIQISTVREMNLPLRPAECEDCNCDFDVFFDGRIELLRAPPIKSNPYARRVILDKMENFVFDPTLECFSFRRNK